MCVVRLSGTYSCLLLIKSLRCKNRCRSGTPPAGLIRIENPNSKERSPYFFKYRPLDLICRRATGQTSAQTVPSPPHATRAASVTSRWCRGTGQALHRRDGSGLIMMRNSNSRERFPYWPLFCRRATGQTSAQTVRSLKLPPHATQAATPTSFRPGGTSILVSVTQRSPEASSATGCSAQSWRSP